MNLARCGNEPSGRAGFPAPLSPGRFGHRIPTTRIVRASCRLLPSRSVHPINEPLHAHRESLLHRTTRSCIRFGRYAQQISMHGKRFLLTVCLHWRCRSNCRNLPFAWLNVLKGQSHLSLEQNDVADLLQPLFERLDAVELTPESILASEAQKEHYESSLMFALRKLQAGHYHQKQVEALIECRREEVAELSAISKPLDNKPDVATHRVTRSGAEFIFELSAFFAAVKSGIDFLAIVCLKHFKGVEGDSIKTLLKLIKSGKVGPILNEIADNTEWLVHVRDYRDHLVHRLVIGTTSGGQVQWKHGSAATTLFPIAVPSANPNYLPDTRRARAFDEPEHRFHTATREASITYPNGKTRQLEHSITMEPAEGYIRIEDLMKRELVAFERFFARIIEALIQIDFAPVQLETRKPMGYHSDHPQRTRRL